MSRTLHILILVLLAAVAVVSCRHEELEGTGVSSVHQGNDGRIRFVAGSAASTAPSTRSSSPSDREFLCAIDSDSLYMSAVVSDNLDNPFADTSVAVKGAPVESLSAFYLSAFLADRLNDNFGSRYIDNIHLSEQVDGVYTTPYYWPNESLHFFATNFAPNITSTTLVPLAEAAGVLMATKSSTVESYNSTSVTWDQPLVQFGCDDEGNPLGTFSYALPEPDPTLKSDAIAQPDYMFAVAPDQTYSETPVPLKFSHCLSAVSFRLGPEFMDPEGRQVKEVKISGVPSSGTCTFSPASGGAVNFDWDTSQADRVTYTQVIPSDGDQTNIENNQVINDGEMTFMLIPHTLNDDARITITFSLHNTKDPVHQHEMVVEKNIADLTAEWLPGKRYTYVITCEETVGIEITDSVTSDVKSNLSITNTGTSVVYVRAYIVGWWENENGDVVAPWTKTDGKFVGNGWEDAGDGTTTFTGTGSNWSIEADGFFYYNLQLWPGTQTDNLFDTYTLTADPPVTGSKLVLDIVTQAVVHYAVKESWPLFASGTVVEQMSWGDEETSW